MRFCAGNIMERFNLWPRNSGYLLLWNYGSWKRTQETKGVRIVAMCMSLLTISVGFRDYRFKSVVRRELKPLKNKCQ